MTTVATDRIDSLQLAPPTVGRRAQATNPRERATKPRSLRALHSWKRTAAGRLVCFVGSIRFAVPLMLLIAVVMAWATFVESAHDSATARRLFYGSWWFITMITLVCASLIAAVATRWPWRRRHVGFITVHASLVLLIIGGFISLFTRVEGTVRLAEGQTAGVMQLEGHELRIAGAAAPSHNSGGSPRAAQTERFPINSAGARFVTADALSVVIDRVFPAAVMEAAVVNDGATPFEAFLVTFGDHDAIWLGETMGPIANHVGDLAVRVLAPEVPWIAPHPDTEPTLFFMHEGNIFGPVVERRQTIPGWWAAAVKRNGDLIEVVLTDGKDSFERHTASLSTPDEGFFERISGAAVSGAMLHITLPEPERLTLQAAAGVVRIGYADTANNARIVREIPRADLPARVDLGPRIFTINEHFTHARQTERLVERRATGSAAPGVRIRVTDNAGRSAIADLSFGVPAVVRVGNTAVQALLAPRETPLPFVLRLDEFRKVDYPGVDMAMAYESDVRVHVGDGTWSPVTISMNKPLVHDGWKVYQASFIGDSVSILSVMKDPGLPLTYFACVFLCFGIAITFYSRSLSTPHPGIPRPERAVS